MKKRKSEDDEFSPQAAARALIEAPGSMPAKLFGDARLLNQHSSQGNARTGQTLGQTIAARQRLIARLKQTDTGMIDVEVLESCNAGESRTGMPCWHWLCPVCGRALCRWISWTAPTALRKVLRIRGGFTDYDAWNRLAVLKLDLFLSPPKLKQYFEAEPLAESIRGLKQMLDDAGVTIAAGVVNVGIIRNKFIQWEAQLAVNFRLIAMRAEVDLFKLKTEIPKEFGRSPSRPIRGFVKMKLLNDRQLAPLFDLLEFQARRKHVDLAPRRNGSSRLRQRSRIRLSTPDELEILLERSGGMRMTDRLFLYGAEVRMNKRGHAVIRPLAETLRARESGKPDLLKGDPFMADLDLC